MESNKKALCERGWNPLNYALLMDENLNGKNTTKNEESLCGIDISMVDKLNVDHGLACDVVSMLAQQQDQEKKRKRQDVRDKRTKTSQAILNDAKKITSGLVFSAGNVHLDNHILSIVKTKVESETKKIEIQEKNKKRKIVKAEKVNKIINSGSSYKTWTNDDLKVMCGYFKKKGYPAVPSRKDELQKYWEKIEEDNPDKFMEKEIEGDFENSKADVDEMNNEEDDNGCNDVVYHGISL